MTAKKKATNREELAEMSLDTANEALLCLNQAIKSDELPIRDLNSIVATCSKIYREIRNEIAAEEKRNLAEQKAEVEEQKEEMFGETMKNLLQDINSAGK
jgi:hypothetical protein